MTNPEPDGPSGSETITEHELAQCQQANQTGRQPVVFVHGLWLLPSSWDRWAALFEDQGYVALTPGWPDDPETVQEATAHPEVFAGKSIGQIADHFATIIGGLDTKPAVVGHSFGGLLTQILAGRGLAKVSVAIDPAPFRGVLPLPISALKSGAPVLHNPANLNPWTEAKVDTHNPDRGPLLIISGEQDHTVPWAVANASYQQQEHNPGVTEIVEMKGRGHALTIDHGWREVADTALAFVQRFTQTQGDSHADR
jgi:pimeloyl-ACP methyl ester carboxylesterase